MPKPSPRRDGREAAVQYLFGHENLDPEENESDEELFALFWSLRTAKPAAKSFAEQLILGVREHQETIDEAIVECLENFRMERLTPVDRNILRLGAYEILHGSDYIPAQAALNEAIEIAKRFGTEDSPKFVNGVLDQVLKNHLSNNP